MRTHNLGGSGLTDLYELTPALIGLLHEILLSEELGSRLKDYQAKKVWLIGKDNTSFVDVGSLLHSKMHPMVLKLAKQL